MGLAEEEKFIQYIKAELGEAEKEATEPSSWLPLDELYREWDKWDAQEGTAEPVHQEP